MILVLASVADDAAAAFVAESRDVAELSLLTCRDLAEERTVLRHPGLAGSAITVDERTVPVERITGVINLLPVVFPEELFFFPPEEREYQAAEFHALLAFLLCALPCPVVNRPAGSSLSGPYTSTIGWYRLAYEMSIPVAPVTIESGAFVHPVEACRDAETIAVSCVGGKIIEPSGTRADCATLALAVRANVAYLRGLYVRSEAGSLELLAAHAVPDARDGATRRALLDYVVASRTARA